jgi:hypothetical protein
LYTKKTEKPPICGKGTAYKIKKLFESGRLELFLTYLQQLRTVGKVQNFQGKNGTLDTIPQQKSLSEQAVVADIAAESIKQKLKKHFEEIGETARALADNVDKLLYYKNIFILSDERPYTGNIVGGLRFNRGSYKDTQPVKVDNHKAYYVLLHYQERWETYMFSNRWEEVTIENASQEIFDNLINLASLDIEEPYQRCPVCQVLSGIMPIEIYEKYYQ